MSRLDAVTLRDLIKSANRRLPMSSRGSNSDRYVYLCEDVPGRPAIASFDGKPDVDLIVALVNAAPQIVELLEAVGVMANATYHGLPDDTDRCSAPNAELLAVAAAYHALVGEKEHE